MKVSAVIDCSTTLLTSPVSTVVSQLPVTAHFRDGISPSASLLITNDAMRIDFACNALIALCELEEKDVPRLLTHRQLYGWLVCLAISRAFEINIGLTIEVPTGPDPRD
jgi:hypothetical protein